MTLNMTYFHAVINVCLAFWVIYRSQIYCRQWCFRCCHSSCLLAHLSASTRISDAHLADTMIGKAVEHMFETEDGTKNEWRGMVLARAPIMNTWFYITYEKDPVLYMYQLLDDYKDGDLRIMPDSSKCFQSLWRSKLMKLISVFKWKLVFKFDYLKALNELLIALMDQYGCFSGWWRCR